MEAHWVRRPGAISASTLPPTYALKLSEDTSPNTTRERLPKGREVSTQRRDSAEH